MKIKVHTLSVIALALFFLTSCKQTKKIELDENSKNKFKIFDINKLPSEASLVEEGAAGGKNPLVIEALPKYYTKRKIFQGLAGLSYDLVYIPGNIVKFDETDSSYTIVTLDPVLLDSLAPSIKSLDNAIVYSSKINNTANFNATALIGSASVGAKEIMEIVIQDVTTSIVPKNYVDKDAIKALISTLPAADLKKYFFVKTATLTLINNKRFVEADLTAKVNASFVTADGRAYSSNNKFSQDRVVSIDLISLKDALL